MKIVLADDERLVRLSLRSMLGELHDQKLIPQPVIKEAASGTELESLLAQFKPHIAIVDIKMPGLSGLDVIESVSLQYPYISWVMLTGYAEFEYAKRAIKVGVLDYLMKPASPDDILRVVSQAEERIRSRARDLQYLGENKLGSIIRGTLSAVFDPWFTGKAFTGGILQYRGYRDDQDRVSSSSRRRREQAFRRVDEILSEWNVEWIPESITAYHITSNSGNLVLAVYTESGMQDEQSGSACMESFHNLIHAILESKVWNWHAVEGSPNADQFMESVNTAEQDFTADALEVGKREASLYGDTASPANFDVPHSIRRREHVEQALKLVQAKYTCEIGLAQIADELGLTPNYLSTEFKRYTGVGFTEYITKLRMDKAAELLKEPGMSVKKAASELGYVSSRYFSKLFTVTYGRKPSDYIAEVRG